MMSAPSSDAMSCTTTASAGTWARIARVRSATVEQLLERFVISQKTLNKRFTAVYGHTPGAAIRRVRTEQAKRWLATTDLSIARIATMCGFGEPSNFNLFFKRETGCTPSKYRGQSR